MYKEGSATESQCSTLALRNSWKMSFGNDFNGQSVFFGKYD